MPKKGGSAEVKIETPDQDSIRKKTTMSSFPILSFPEKDSIAATFTFGSYHDPKYSFPSSNNKNRFTQVNESDDPIDSAVFEDEMKNAEKKLSGFKNNINEYIKNYDSDYGCSTRLWKEPSPELKDAVDELIQYLNGIPDICAVRAVKLYSGIKLIPDAWYDPESYNRYETSDWDRNVEEFNKVYQMRGYKNASAFFGYLRDRHTKVSYTN
jgi:hypothetical protein